MVAASPTQRMALHAATSLLANAGPALARVAPIRQMAVSRVEKWLLKELKESRTSGTYPPGVADDRTLLGMAILHTVERALVDRRLSTSAQRGIFKVLVQSLLIEQGDQTAAARFCSAHKAKAPTFLVISPGKACNLRCTGCYADAGTMPEPAAGGGPGKLDWDVFERVINEAKAQWGTRFFVISGGEPFAYRSQGKGVVDMAERHPDCLFMAYSNGTLISDQVAGRLARAGNLFPAISVEGWRERTDERRGRGVFDKVLDAMDRLRSAQVPFGLSLTATRHNVEEILSEDFIDFFFAEQGALFGWVFHYMPIGRSFTLDLMPTPQQRIWMWRRSWEIIREKQHFLVDFWNHGTACDGCLSAGGHGAGGYMYVDWNGAVSPCVFLPYSPVNIKRIYERGGTMSDVWADPFFGALRGWQTDYRKQNGNLLAPCPIRDHHMDLRHLLADFEPDPTDANAEAALLDPNYARGMAQYDAAYQALADEVWQQHYLRPADPQDGHIVPLPNITQLLQTAPSAAQPEPVHA